MKQTCIVVLLLLVHYAVARTQPFFQLDPKPMYKEDVEFSASDWAGFYRTADKGIMLILPNVGNSIQGLYVSEDGGRIRFFKGERKGNGITYSYYETFLGDEDNDPWEDAGHGFMVMKDDGEKENVYCKDGDGGPAEGNFTAGKKLSLVVNKGEKTSATKWEGAWNGGEEKLKDLLRIEKFKQPYTYIGFYTLEGYSTTDVSNYFSSGSWTTSIRTKEMPDRIVMVLGIAYGEKLYFISSNRVEVKVSAGIMTQLEENKLRWSAVDIDDIKDLNEHEGTLWFREK